MNSFERLKDVIERIDSDLVPESHSRDIRPPEPASSRGIKLGDRFRHKNGMVYTVTRIDGNVVKHRGPFGGEGWSFGDTFFNWFTRESAEPLGASDPVQGPEPLSHDFSDPYCVAVGVLDGIKTRLPRCAGCGVIESDDVRPFTGNAVCVPRIGWRYDDDECVETCTDVLTIVQREPAFSEPSEPSYSGLGAAQFGAWDGYAGSSRRR